VGVAECHNFPEYVPIHHLTRNIHSSKQSTHWTFERKLCDRGLCLEWRHHYILHSIHTVISRRGRSLSSGFNTALSFLTSVRSMQCPMCNTKSSSPVTHTDLFCHLLPLNDIIPAFPPTALLKKQWTFQFCRNTKNSGTQFPLALTAKSLVTGERLSAVVTAPNGFILYFAKNVAGFWTFIILVCPCHN
jgi:hypothetical protein